MKSIEYRLLFISILQFFFFLKFMVISVYDNVCIGIKSHIKHTVISQKANYL